MKYALISVALNRELINTFHSGLTQLHFHYPHTFPSLVTLAAISYINELPSKVTEFQMLSFKRRSVAVNNQDIICGVLSSNFGYSDSDILCFSAVPQVNSKILPLLGNDQFLPNTFQFIIHQLPYQSTL
jgi:hypothetical protein